MNKITIIIISGLFWIILATTINYVSKDTVLQAYASVGNYSLTEAEYNISAFPEASTTNLLSSSSWLNTLKILFGFGIPTTSFPTGLAVFISSINWLIVLVMLITAYRLVIPTGD